MMTEFRKFCAAAATFGLAALPAFAQDATAPAAADQPAASAPAPAADAATPDTAAPSAAPAPAAQAPAKPADGPGTSYIKQTFNDWSLQCFRTQDGNDPCQMYQLMKDAKGNSVADISMVALPPGGKAVAGATIMTPLETLLTSDVTLKVDNAEPKVYPFTFCAPMGCFARVGLTADELAAFKKGTSVGLTIVPIAAPDHPVTVTLSLKGFTSAFDAVTKNAADVAAAQKPAK